MKYWTRTTHNFNNETREWEYRGDTEKIPLSLTVTKSPLGIHALDSGAWKTLSEISRENFDYCQTYPENKQPTIEEVLEDLNKLEELGLVKSKEI